jgi:hypothetical protein
MNDYLMQYVRYIQNTGMARLPIQHFDDDWEPIGPSVRAQLLQAGITMEESGTMVLRHEFQGASEPTGEKP